MATTTATMAGENVSHTNQDDFWSRRLREMRHSPCLMSPLSVVVLLIFCLFSFISLITRAPSVVLGIVLSPVLQRSQWFIEFLYPSGIARWAHLYLVRMNASKRTEKTHSRTLEQRFEIVKGRVFVHPIPQLLDNVAYLVVCLPGVELSNESVEITVGRAEADLDEGDATGQTSSSTSSDTIVAFLVDCGDAASAMEQMRDIRKSHYPSFTIQLQAILSTHKHHDHTAGNKLMVRDSVIGVHLRNVYGAAVERVPFCNSLVKNGQLLDLPKVDGNDMNDAVQVEVVAVPGHTRGSLAYVLSGLPPMKHCRASNASPVAVFTGDTLFSAGAGVSFEADFQPPSDLRKTGKTLKSCIRASAGSNAVERCFTELVVRSRRPHSELVFFPGHEYTSDLLARQFHPTVTSEANQWSRFSPAVFFATVSELYVTTHRRSQVKDGRLLTVPTSLERELAINPTMRQMRKRGEDVVRAVQLWYRHFAQTQIPHQRAAQNGVNGKQSAIALSGSHAKTPSTEASWTVGVKNISNSVFSTIYTDDLDQLIEGLGSGRIQPDEAVAMLKEFKSKMTEPTVARRPIPGTLPTERTMYQAILGFALLGSAPAALTFSDSRAMNLPPPLSPRKSDKLLISKSRLVGILTELGVAMEDRDGRDVALLMDLLWQEAATGGPPARQVEYRGVQSDDSHDFVELGTLKWIMYGVETGQPRFCFPCVSKRSPSKNHPIHDTKMRRTNGELVRHDIFTCPLCRNATGCDEADKEEPIIESANGFEGEDTDHSLFDDRSPRRFRSDSMIELRRL